ncbi:MAG TPA: hypothetical protein DCM05_14665 [Elusimicrobia bacterium]|nr:hypothetical protein [Elusimicrobiota bacterium]
MIEPVFLALAGGFAGLCVLGAAASVWSRAAAARRRREFEQGTGGRYTEGLGERTLLLDRKGLSLTIRLRIGPENQLQETAAVSIPVSLSPQAEFYVGPRVRSLRPVYYEPIGKTSLPELSVELPWLGGMEARGEPEKAAAAVLSRVGSLDEFLKVSLTLKQLACTRSTLMMTFTRTGRFRPADLDALAGLCADLAFKLMG